MNFVNINTSSISAKKIRDQINQNKIRSLLRKTKKKLKPGKKGGKTRRRKRKKKRNGRGKSKIYGVSGMLPNDKRLVTGVEADVQKLDWEFASTPPGFPKMYNQLDPYGVDSFKPGNEKYTMGWPNRPKIIFKGYKKKKSKKKGKGKKRKRSRKRKRKRKRKR
jgi:hypothetical protein